MQQPAGLCQCFLYDGGTPNAELVQSCKSACSPLPGGATVKRGTERWNVSVVSSTPNPTPPLRNGISKSLQTCANNRLSVHAADSYVCALIYQCYWYRLGGEIVVLGPIPHVAHSITTMKCKTIGKYFRHCSYYSKSFSLYRSTDFIIIILTCHSIKLNTIRAFRATHYHFLYH